MNEGIISKKSAFEKKKGGPQASGIKIKRVWTLTLGNRVSGTRAENIDKADGKHRSFADQIIEVRRGDQGWEICLIFSIKSRTSAGGFRL